MSLTDHQPAPGEGNATHKVQVGAAMTGIIQLPDGLPHKANDIVMLTEEQFNRIPAAEFSSGHLIDLGETLTFDITAVAAGAPAAADHTITVRYGNHTYNIGVVQVT